MAAAIPFLLARYINHLTHAHNKHSDTIDAHINLYLDGGPVDEVDLGIKTALDELHHKAHECDCVMAGLTHECLRHDHAQD